MKTLEELKNEGFIPMTCLDGIYNSLGDSLYFINRVGDIYSLRSKRVLNKHKHSLGYVQIYITNFCGGGRWHKVHRLVSLQFIPNELCLSDVNHKNGIKTDNRVENLEWLSHSDNIKHSYHVLGRVHDGSYLAKKVKCSNGKTYPTAISAANDTGCKSSNVSMCCTKKIKQSKGFTFEFI